MEKAEDVNPNQVTSLRCQFTPEYSRPAAIGTTRALLQGVEFVRYQGSVSESDTDGEGDNSGVDGGGSGSDDGQNENPLG